MVKYSVVIIILILYNIISNSVSTPDSEGRTYNVFGKLKSGFQFAGKLLGIDRASGVAQLVTDAFGKTHKKGDGNEDSNIFSGFLRILGFDTKKIGAIAVNAIIFFAQLISSSVKGTPPSQLVEARKINSGTPFDWLMNHTKVNNLLIHATDKELPKHIVNYIQEHSLDEDTACIQLLICKSAPFVWGMQKALENRDNKTNTTGMNALFAYLPSLDEVSINGDKCEKNHRLCLIDL